MCGIYKITNNINGKIYIGQSVNIQQRWCQHKWEYKKENRLEYNSIIHKAFRKYGIENFSFEIIEECSPNLLDEKERYWISKLKTLQPNGYNVMEGGQGKRGKIQLCADCGKVISRNSIRCVECNKKYRLLILNKQIQRPAPLELARLVKENGFEGTGRLFSLSGNAIKKWCLSYGIPHRKKELTDWYNFQIDIEENDKKEFKENRKSVKQIDLNTGEVLQVFQCMNDAAKFLGKKSNSHIVECCKGKLKQAYGFKWEYNE